MCSTQILRTVFSPGGAAYPTYRPSGAKNENIGVYCYTHYAPPGLIYKESLVQEARFARDATKSLLRRTIEKAREDVKQKVHENRKIRRAAAEKIDRNISVCILSKIGKS